MRNNVSRGGRLAEERILRWYSVRKMINVVGHLERKKKARQSRVIQRGLCASPYMLRHRPASHSLPSVVLAIGTCATGQHLWKGRYRAPANGQRSTGPTRQSDSWLVTREANQKPLYTQRRPLRTDAWSCAASRLVRMAGVINWCRDHG